MVTVGQTNECIFCDNIAVIKVLTFGWVRDAILMRGPTINLLSYYLYS